MFYTTLQVYEARAMDLLGYTFTVDEPNPHSLVYSAISSDPFLEVILSTTLQHQISFLLFSVSAFSSLCLPGESEKPLLWLRHARRRPILFSFVNTSLRKPLAHTPNLDNHRLSQLLLGLHFLDPVVSM
jgi:hypothetical protein